MYIQRRRIFASDEMIDDVANDEMMDDGMGEVSVEPEASDLLFEAEDVAQLVAEVTGDAVDVTADEGVVTFAVGDDEFVVEAEGDEEVLESVKVRKKPIRSSSKASRGTRRPGARRPVKSSTRTVRKVPSKKRK